MEFIKTYAKEIFALLVTLVAWVAGNKSRAAAMLQLARPRNVSFRVEASPQGANDHFISPGQTVYTVTHLLRNTGRETATGVELVFNWKPLCMNVWPSRHFDEYTENDGRYILIFNSLAPGEQISFELMSVNRELPHLVNARSDQCTATTIDMSPQPVRLAWMETVDAILILAGIAFVAYILMILLQFLVLG